MLTDTFREWDSSALPLQTALQDAREGDSTKDRNAPDALFWAAILACCRFIDFTLEKQHSIHDDLVHDRR